MSTAKMDGWKPQSPPDPEMCKVLHDFVNQAVYAIYNTTGESAGLGQIYNVVRKKVVEAKASGTWKWGVPGKRTVDRRVNEAASPLFAEDGVPKIVSQSAGVYRPNPKRFEAS